MKKSSEYKPGEPITPKQLRKIAIASFAAHALASEKKDTALIALRAAEADMRKSEIGKIPQIFSISPAHSEISLTARYIRHRWWVDDAGVAEVIAEQQVTRAAPFIANQGVTACYDDNSLVFHATGKPEDNYSNSEARDVEGCRGWWELRVGILDVEAKAILVAEPNL